MGVEPVTLKPDDVRAEHAPHAGTDPTRPWEALGVRVATSERRLGALKGGGVSAARLVPVDSEQREFAPDAGSEPADPTRVSPASPSGLWGPRKAVTCPTWSER